MTVEEPNLLALENQVCFALAVAARSVIGLYRPILEQLGLTHPQYLVMLALWEHEPRSVRELGEALELEPATLSPLLKRLETAKLVSRTRSTLDERRLEVTLTASGRALRSEAEKVPSRIIERLQLPLQDLTAIQKSLRTIIAAATATPASASASASAHDTISAKP